MLLILLPFVTKYSSNDLVTVHLLYRQTPCHAAHFLNRSAFGADQVNLISYAVEEQLSA